ncbi:membrane protease YdiL (CAAX protease family) [Promicromonospora sp. AC04]|uniref:CPBP family intramembrane glutamic endopeptidase n=1 Tax=Promicromonospora sp. AC04 TaxID=2135723 RepID=UPI000D3C66DF|nr:type II CAAX endopeptidase family protein [Promicromonospora sp. AC04]PUB32524.1 membrane protease YdiL (CAAX protease family) [Promicromonospora sp. AC04]
MTAPPTISRLHDVGWSVLVPSAVVAVYLGAGAAVVLVVGDPIIGTAALGGLIATLICTTRLVRPRWLAHEPGRRAKGATPRFGWSVVACTALAFLAGQSLALWIYATAGSAGFDRSIQARQMADLEAALLLTLLAAPLGEEALFRGLIYPLLRKRVGVLASVVVTTVAFGFLHGNVVQLALVLPLAVVLGLVYEHTRVLWPCMLSHAIFNLAATVVPAQMLVPLANPLATTALSLAFAGSTWMLYRHVVEAGRSAHTAEGRRIGPPTSRHA